MAIFKCKMCGGTLEIKEGSSICTCEFCDTQQTLPKVQDENLQNLFNRANVLRMKSEFDKAAEIYEKIIQNSETESEAYWGMILCKYGIEYVEDPKTFKRIPTCHRASYDSVVSDEDYQSAIKYADAVQRDIYEQQAAEIDTIQKGIIALAQKEDPYDVFICYKETDESEKRTQDSVIANDIYYQLTHEGFKVFYSAITLEDKLGTEYEPYIFSALNTSQVMLSLGTKPEYFNAVWVKNEWSRFLKIMKKDHSKLLIPCYRDMDPYELPEEFSHLQAQDMSKIGFISDIVRGIKKVIVKDSNNSKTQETVVVQQSSNTTVIAQVKRGNMALEDNEWDKADAFFEEALNIDPECAEAYIGKLLAKEKKPDFDSWVSGQMEKYSSATTEHLACPADTAHISKIVSEYAIANYLDGETIRKEYEFDLGYDSAFSCRKEQKAKQLNELSRERLLTRAKQYAKGDTQKQIEYALVEITAVLDQRIADAQEANKTSVSRIKTAYEAHLACADKKVEILNGDVQNLCEKNYKAATTRKKNANDIPAYERARDDLMAMNGYKDSDELVAQCQKELDRLNEEKRQEEERQEAIRKEEAERAEKKLKKIISISSVVVVVFIVFVFVFSQFILPTLKFNAEVSALTGVTIGDTVTYGTYQGEDIEWLVLDVSDNQALIISKYALDCQPYNSSCESVTWESCSLRTWLNTTFISDAFSAKERGLIATTTVIADQNPEYSTIVGNDTQDQIFLLSSTEVLEYFSSVSARQCQATSYAGSQKENVSSSNAIAWWLRSPGNNSKFAAYVSVGGAPVDYGHAVNSDNVCVRPAMRINLES